LLASMVKISDIARNNELPTPGKLSETLVFEKDIVSLLGELT